MKKIFKFLILVLIAGIVVIITTGVIIYRFGETSKPVKSDCIIILGCRLYGSIPSPFLQGRMNHAIELYNNGYGNYIIASGGKGAGESITEAEAMKGYLIKKGIPSDKIICEDNSYSTMTNLVNSSKKMNENGLKTAIIVSNKYHTKRASLMADKCGIKATASGIYMSKYPFDETIGFLREILALWKFYILGN